MSSFYSLLCKKQKTKKQLHAFPCLYLTLHANQKSSCKPIVVTMVDAKMTELAQSHVLRWTSPVMVTPCPAASDTVWVKHNQSRCVMYLSLAGTSSCFSPDPRREGVVYPKMSFLPESKPFMQIRSTFKKTLDCF